MKVKELFKVIDTTNLPDVSIIDNTNSRSITTFKYPHNGDTYIQSMLNQFGNRIVEQNGVTFGTDILYRQSITRWYKTSDKYPEMGEFVLGYNTTEKIYTVVKWDGTDWIDDNFCCYNIDYWTELVRCEV